MINVGYDWSQHYFHQGYADGRDEGLVIGSEDGYAKSYPVAYAINYNVGFLKGVNEGSSQGKRDGQKEGYDDGWDEGLDTGHDGGFSAGVDYFLYGEFAEPKYSLAYVKRSDVSTRGSLLALQAPEPASLFSLGLAGLALVGVRRPRG
jgi:hypothetical protein